MSLKTTVALVVKCRNACAGEDIMFCPLLKVSSPSEYHKGISNTKREIGMGGSSALISGICCAFAAFPTAAQQFMGMSGVEVTDFRLLCASAYVLVTGLDAVLVVHG
jgi:hypothetical protein